MKILALFLVLIAVGATACGTSRDATSTPRQPTATRAPNTVLQSPEPFVKTPDFTLPTATGGTVRLSDYREKQPVVVVFYRGFF